MKAAPAPQKSPVLPLPEAVVNHHLQTLSPWIRSWREQNRVPPVLLLTGIEGVGKRSMSYYLAQWLLCEQGGFSSAAPTADVDAGPDLFGGGLFGETLAEAAPSPAKTTDGPCNECRSCKKALQSTWVDFREIGLTSGATQSGEESDTEESSHEKLKIDVFRELKNSAGFGSHEGGYRIFLVRDADRMTPQAANSMLKLLEEPPAGWVMILTASDSSLLLPTVVSRCQRIRLKPFGAQELSTILSAAGVPSERLELSIQLGQGSWKKSLLSSDDSHREKRESVLKFLANPPENLTAVLDWSSTSAESLALLLELLEPCQQQLLRWALGAKSLQDPHPFDGFLTSHLKYVSVHLRHVNEARQFWLERAERMARARQEIRLPLNKKLLTQEILLPYLLS